MKRLFFLCYSKLFETDDEAGRGKWGKGMI